MDLKTLLSKAVMMHHPDFSIPFHVYCDASSRAIGGVLIQIINGEIVETLQVKVTTHLHSFVVSINSAMNC